MKAVRLSERVVLFSQDSCVEEAVSSENYSTGSCGYRKKYLFQTVYYEAKTIQIRFQNIAVSAGKIDQLPWRPRGLTKL